MSVIDQSLTKAQVAYAFGVDERTISRWQDRDDNPLPIAERRKTKAGNVYDLRQVVEWARRDAIGELTVGGDGQVLDYNTERARLTKAQADKTELEVAELQGTLIRVPAVTAHWQTKVAAVRARLLSLPTKLASAIAPPDRLGAAQDQAQALIYEALAELAGDGIPDDVRERAAAIRRSRDRSDVASAAAADDQPVGRGKPGAQRGGQRRARKVSAE